VIPRHRIASQTATPMATITLCLGRPTQQLPCPIEPNKSPETKTRRPANGRFALGRADLPTQPPMLSAKQHWPTHQISIAWTRGPRFSCNEGFCNASERQRLPSATDMASQKPHRSANAHPAVCSQAGRCESNKRMPTCCKCLQRRPRDYASSRCGRIPRSLCVYELNANGISSRWRAVSDCAARVSAAFARRRASDNCVSQQRRSVPRCDSTLPRIPGASRSLY